MTAILTAATLLEIIDPGNLTSKGGSLAADFECTAGTKAEFEEMENKQDFSELLTKFPTARGGWNAPGG
jgi:hypothetical protein